LLTRALDDAGIDRHLVYVTNAVKHFKWRPAGQSERREPGIPVSSERLPKVEQGGPAAKPPRAGSKVRLHQKPNASEIRACSQWWHAEVAAIDPELMVLLGATAAQAVLGPKVRVTRDRGRFLPVPAAECDALVTIHPSAVLRTSGEERDEAMSALVRDLELVATRL